ncbi:ATP-grasp fold amidoligase family protein [Bacillus sp. es.034]|uniref:ATP-grasp fold amidoligase family protein n=1 Tax=Bacillus sp. es.034 TaxID=1761763 RepID=UPI000C00E111|nr:ATP-grasp fold amidoligase family protein [Bacillus sp. es.034]PFG04477.1 teichuronopeptide biosynthesis TupA-like protein [Bacillus sp. es.034]
MANDRKIIKILQNPGNMLFSLGYRGFFNWMPDKFYLKMIYRSRLKRKLNLKAPKTYNEKLQWLKLHDKNPAYTKLVDKYEVRKYIKHEIGEEYLVPLLGVYEDVDQIEFNSLPEKFVLKCTHDSGGVIVCTDKSVLNIQEVKKQLKERMKKNYYWSGRENPYKEIKPRIIVEKFMMDKKEEELKDYKFFCFNGEPKALFIASERSTGNTKFDFFDMDFNHLPFMQHYPNSNNDIKKPSRFDEMIELSKALSKRFPHVRIDFYEVNGRLYFGEYTFYHFSGFRRFEPERYDKLFGDWLQLE